MNASRSAGGAPPPGNGRRIGALRVAVFAVALALRAWNAHTAWHNPDEAHYATDGLWAHVEASDFDAVDFLRRHAEVHRRIDPAGYRVDEWPPAMQRISFLAHPALQAWVLGAVLAPFDRPDAATAVAALRALDLVADASVTLLLVPFVAALGGSAAAGLAAAALYAVFPPAVVYGSMANQDAFLAPLLLLALLGPLRPAPAAAAWAATGLWTGLAIASKATGLFVAPVVALVALLRRPPGWMRGLALCAVVAVATTTLFVDPVGYARLFLDPPVKVATVTFAPWTRLTGNLRFLADVGGYYMLSYWQHGEPWAPAFARAHQLVTPLFHVAWAAALVALAARRRVALLAVVAGPVVALLAWLNPTDGIWRVHVLGPLLAATIALGWSALPRAARAAVLAAGLALAVRPLLPAVPDKAGHVDLAGVLFANPSHRQQPTTYRAVKGRPVVVTLAPRESVTRTLRVPPGDYDVRIVADGAVLAALDETSWPVFGETSSRVTVGRRTPQLALTALDGPATVRLVELRPVDPGPLEQGRAAPR